MPGCLVVKMCMFIISLKMLYGKILLYLFTKLNSPKIPVVKEINSLQILLQ